MASLREWLIKHEWFILECDPNPGKWYIIAMSPSGRVIQWTGSETKVGYWHEVGDNW